MQNAPDTDIDVLAEDGLLPGLVQTLIGVIGVSATRAVVQALGGTTIYVPKVVGRAGEMRYEHLAELIGVNAADALVDHFAGDILHIPRCRAAMIEYERREIRQAFDRMTLPQVGLSASHAVASLARAYNYSDRHIWSILKRPDRRGAQQPARVHDDRTLPLF